MKKAIPHDKLQVLSNILMESTYHSDAYLNWWTGTHHAAFIWALGATGKRQPASVLFYKEALGRQDTTIVFLYRCYVWHRPEEGWTLYVDKRGPKLHVTRGMSLTEAWEAFQRFAEHINNFIGIPEGWLLEAKPAEGATEAPAPTRSGGCPKRA